MLGTVLAILHILSNPCSTPGELPFYRSGNWDRRMKSSSLGLVPNKLHSWDLNQEVLFYQLFLPFSSAQSCPTLCNPMDCSMPGFPVLHSLSPKVCSNSCPLSQWCHPTISSSVAHFSCPQSFPASESFLMSRLFALGGQSIGSSASASVLLMNVQGWFPLGLTGLIPL